MLSELGSSTPQPSLQSVDIDMVLGSQWLDFNATSEINLDFLSKMDSFQPQNCAINLDFTDSSMLGATNIPAHLRNQSADLNPRHQARPTSTTLNPQSPPESRQLEQNLEITEEYWHSMQAEIDQIGGPKLPSRTKLNQYILRYLACFHRHQPLFHESTWFPVECPVPLTLAVCANGAMYILERTIAVELFHAAVDLSKLANEGICRLQLSMLLIAFAAWSGNPEDLDIGMQFHARLALDLRREWAKAKTMPNFDTTTWAGWRERETLKRYMASVLDDTDPIF